MNVIFDTINKDKCFTLFQFLTLSAEDEKTQLIPVLTTMLRLSADEVNILKESASGNVKCQYIKLINT